jgi:type IV fimbrial biogenesis protein FimT
MHYKNTISGFTLIELIVTISIASILMAIGAPSLARVLKNNQVSGLYNEVVSVLAYTRSSAVTKGAWVTFCKSNLNYDGCAPISASWENGWIVFEDANNDGSIAKNERILLVKNDLPRGFKLNFSRSKSRISYGQEGYAVGYNGKFTVCDSSKTIKKSMVISNSGRVRLADSNERGECE